MAAYFDSDLVQKSGKNNRYQVNATNIIVGDPHVSLDVEIIDLTSIRWVNATISGNIAINGETYPLDQKTIYPPKSPQSGPQPISLPFGDEGYASGADYSINLDVLVDPAPTQDRTIELHNITGTTQAVDQLGIDMKKAPSRKSYK